MSIPPAPTPSPTHKTVTSPILEDLVASPTQLFRFSPDILDLIVDLVAPGTPSRDILRQGINALLSDHWQVIEWKDLKVFTADDVAAALVAGGVPPELSKPVIVKKLGYVVEYAQFGTLSAELTMDDIIDTVKPRVHPTSPASPARRNVQIVDKKAVPTLEKFTGRDEDYYTWRESTINVVGAAGLGRFLTDDQMYTKHPDIGESLFYALRGAVHGGQAQSIAQGMLDEKRLDPVALWSAVEAYYDTALNRANVVLFDFRRLLSIRLDPDTTATKFISDFRDCLQRLRKNNSRIAEDTDALRTLLLVAIQDDDFEMVRDSIVHKPGNGVETILTEIRERETSLMMKDAGPTLGGDGSGTTRYSRRTGQSSSRGQMSTTGGTNSNSTTRKWYIPKFPDTWKQAIGGSFFKLLIEWRTEAHKGKTQAQLNDHFATVVESVKQGASGGSKKARSKSRRSSKSPTGGDSTSDAGGNMDSTADSDGQGDDPQRKRIRLQKSRRVVTERNA